MKSRRVISALVVTALTGFAFIYLLTRTSPKATVKDTVSEISQGLETSAAVLPPDDTATTKTATSQSSSDPIAPVPLTQAINTEQSKKKHRQTSGNPIHFPGGRQGKPWHDATAYAGATPRERVEHLLNATFSIQDNGGVSALTLAKDKLYMRHLSEPAERLITIPEQKDAAGVMKEAETRATPGQKLPQLVFYVEGKERNEMSMRILSDEVILEAADVPQAMAAAQRAGLANAAAMEEAPGFVLASDNRFPGSALAAAASLEGAIGVTDTKALLGRKVSHKLIPNDPQFSKQWHLRQSGSNHANVVDVWDTNQGASMTIGIIDDGTQIGHPDLVGNLDSSIPSLHYDYVGNDSDPSPSATDRHGTAVTGLAAAVGNNGIGVSGVAPAAKIVGLRLTAGTLTASNESAAFGRRNDVIELKNNSWGPPDDPAQLGYMDSTVRSALQNAVTTGRGGLGTIFTFAGGNGRDLEDQSNKDAYANSIYTFGIAALTKSGTPARYSEYGTNIIASAPADGVTTTDLTGSNGYHSSDYTSSFDGTSAACPVATGVIALMLEANPALGWRDVKEILLRSGRKVAPSDTEWVSRSGGKPLLPAIKHNPKYGGGMVNAAAATALAVGWTNLPASQSRALTDSVAAPVFTGTSVSRTFNFTAQPPLRVEMVEITVDISHTFKGDLAINLTSPSGVVSRLATPTLRDGQSGYNNWTFTSVRHWGESSAGTWRLSIADQLFDDDGTYFSSTIRLHGVPAPAADITSVTGDQAALVGQSVNMSATATGFADLSYQWTLAGKNVLNGTSSLLNLPSVTLAQGGTYHLNCSNVTGSDTSTSRLAVIQPPPATYIANVDKTLTLKTTVQAPSSMSLGYAWYKDGSPVNNDPPGSSARISGATSPTLNILRSNSTDTGEYHCKVTVASLPVVSTPITDVSIRYKPDILSSAFPTDLIVSRFSSIPLSILNGTTSVTITGLPKGLTYNKVTGNISGTPSASVTNIPITIRATNLAGTSLPVTIMMTIQALPAQVVGRFDGLLARNAHPQGGSNYGGKILNLLITPTGSFTGKIQIANLSYSLGGRLAASTTADPLASVLISRGRTLPRVQLTFSIDRSNGHLTGQLEDVPLAPPAAWSATVDAWRNPFSTTNPNTTTVGVHNYWADSPSTDAAVAPQGASTGSLTVSRTGGVSFSLKTGDGVGVTGSTTIGTTGIVPLFSMLYSNKGSVHGKVTITDAVAPSMNTMTGALTWNKTGPSSGSDRTYKLGFDFGVTNGSSLTVIGSEYVKPPTTVPPTFLWGMADVPTSGTNASVMFTGSAVDGNPAAIPPVAPAELLTSLNRTLRIGGAHVATFASPNLATLKLNISSANGNFSGSALIKDGIPAITRSLTFGGVVANGQTMGKGWFKIVRVPQGSETLSNAPIQSGTVTLQ
jgi:subtilisin-like proprotein convertase family protein